MRILFASLRQVSHLQPLVPFIEACLAQGHEVGVATPIDFAERVAKTGATLFPVGHPGDAGLGPIWQRMNEVSDEEALRMAIGEIFAGACAKAALPALLETLQTWKPSIVVRESLEFASLLASEKLGVPHARVGILLRSAELRLMTMALPALDAHTASLGLPADASGQRIVAEPSLTLFPESLEPVDTRSELVRRFRAPRKQAAALPDWWPGRSDPLVYLTLGTVVGGVAHLHAVYRTALAAVGTLPLRVLLTIGNDLPLDVLGEVPSNVHVERFVPQDDVLPHAAAVVCHGGSGTVIGTLAAGLPMVVAPLGADQPDNAARVMQLGAGVGLPTGTATADQIREALSRVLEQAAFRTEAKRCADEIAALPEVSQAPAELERLVKAHAKDHA